MFFLLLNLSLVLGIILLLLLLSMVWPPDSPWAPFWSTKPQTARSMCKLAHVNKNTLVYDLGCGTGTALIIAGKEFHAKAVGVEIDPLRYIISLLNIKINKLEDKIKIVRNNFFRVDLSKADVFFIYLIPNALKRLTPKLLKEVKYGALFVSYVYPFPVEMFNGRLKLVEHDGKNRIYVYKMRK